MKAKTQKKNRKKRARLIRIILLLLLIACSVVLLMMSPLFTISNIAVNGCTRYQKDDIIKSSNLAVGMNGFRNIGSNVKNIFTLHYGNAEESIKKNRSYIKTVSARFSLPHTVEINIRERIPRVAIPLVDQFLILDEEGVVLEKSATNPNLVVVNGVNIREISFGEPLVLENKDILKTVYTLLNAVKQTSENEMQKTIQTLDVNDIQNTKVVIDQERIVLNLGYILAMEEKTLLERVRFAGEILKKLNPDDRGTIDFTTGKNPHFIPKEI